jgi:hypothetical protein
MIVLPIRQPLLIGPGSTTQHAPLGTWPLDQPLVRTRSDADGCSPKTFAELCTGSFEGPTTNSREPALTGRHGECRDAFGKPL